MADKKKPGADLDENGYDNNPDSYKGITRTITDEKGNQLSHTIGQDEIDAFKKEKAAAKLKSDISKKNRMKKLYPTLSDQDAAESK